MKIKRGAVNALRLRDRQYLLKSSMITIPLRIRKTRLRLSLFSRIIPVKQDRKARLHQSNKLNRRSHEKFDWRFAAHAQDSPEDLNKPSVDSKYLRRSGI